MRRALRTSPHRAPRIRNPSSSYRTTHTTPLLFLPPLLSKLCFTSALNHHGFLLSAPFLLNKGCVFSAPLNTPALRGERSSNLGDGLPSVDKRAPFSTSSGRRSTREPSSSICSCESERTGTQMEFDSSVVSAICRSVISRCSHVWEEKDGASAEASSLLDFVKLSIGLSPQTMRRFWRVSALRPEEVLEILTGFGPKVGRKEVDFLLKLFIWSGKQTGDFRHLPKSYDMMISMLIGTRMFREAESLLLETQTCGVFVPGLNRFFSVIIQAYVEACDLKGSVALYERAGSLPDVVLTVSCYQALLRWLVELERADLAHRTYTDMVDMGLVTRNENFALDFVVRTLCRNGKVLEAANLLRRVRDLGIESGRASLDSIADGYRKKRDFEDLLNFLKKWQHMPSIYLCNRILSCLCRTLGTDRAWLFMQSLEVLGFEADAKTFEIFIRWSCQEGRLRNAFMYVSEVFSRMLRPDFHVYNALLSGVFKEGMWKYAKDVYADMVEKGIILDMSTFRVILAGYCRERRFDEVTHILGDMANLGFVCLSPSEDTLSKVFALLGLDCLCVKVKRDNNMLFPKAEFFDSLGNGLYLDTDIHMYEKILVKILDDAMFPDFDVVVQEECRKGEMETSLMMMNEAAQYGKLLSFSTYSELVKGLITSGSFIKEAASVLEEIPELHNHLDHHTLNLLLQAFSKNGFSVKEKLISDVLYQRELPVETDTCSAIITAICKRGDLNGFREFWYGPQRSSWMPKFKDIRFLLSSLLKWGMLKEVFDLLERMSLKYPQLIPAISNAFVKKFCTTAFPTVGYVLADEVLQRGLALEKSTYEHLIKSLCREKKVTEAFHILDVMLEKNVTPSTGLCQRLVHMLFRSSWMKKDEPLKQVNWSEESDVLFPFREALLNEVHRVGQIAKAGPELQKLQIGGLLPFQSILDIMIQTYCRENNFRKASELLCLVIKMHLRLGISTYRDLVRLTCSSGRIQVGLNLKDLMLREYGFPPHTIHNIMIFYLLQGGNSSSMDVILDDMQRQFCSPDQISFNFLIHGYYKCGNAEKSVDLLNTMISKNLQPNNRSLRTVLCYLCSHLRLNEAMELSQTMEGKGWKLGSVTQTTLVESLLSHGRLHEAEQLLGRLEAKNLIPDKACYDTLIKCFCRFGRVNTAVNLLNLMLKKGNLPSENSYSFVLQGFLVCNSFDEALDIHAEMLHKKIQLGMELYDMLIHGLCANGRTGDAERVLNVMMAYGEVPTRSMFRAVFDKYHSENNLFKTSELLEKMQQHGILPDFETHWSLISNLNSVNVTKDNNRDNSGKGFLTQLLSQTGFPAKGSKTKGANTALKQKMVDSRFRELLDHSKMLLKKKWFYGILDDFITKQLPHNVTWGLSLLYAMEHQGDRALIATQGQLAHALCFLASVVSQSFLAFGDILELHRKYLELTGGINRIFELEELLDAAQSEILLSDEPESFSHGNSVAADNIISFSEVDIITPAQKLLARKLTCEIAQGKSLLVTGPNGSGKSSIFRILRGLWPIASGRLIKPCQNIGESLEPECGIFYIPQRPYTSLGTLRDQIIYPLSREEAEIRVLQRSGRNDESASHPLDVHLRTILENVRLVYLLERDEKGWDASPNWEDILSLGEQQRLGMARLFFHHPKFGILDECTNATSVDVEEHLYRLANELGITVVTSSQRPALIPFHSMELHLIDGEGKWELRSINQSAS